MAVRAQKSDVFRTVVCPIAIDVLDLEWDAPGVRIPLTPSALLAFFARGVDDVLPNNPVEIQSRRQFAGSPQRDDSRSIVFELTAL
jgi:hypothetical protein